ncbi:glucosyltransferase domain-containing protein [Pseudomonas sp. 18175]|uniref:glucosyltransferase domain-containing protein n=1 Tax=Pseudomonas sp. 18175 TaxID=3390056 RepID=UPI003D1FB16E
MDNHVMQRELTRSEVLCFFAIALCVYSWPLISVGYLYYDDVWRTYFSPASWTAEGRLLISPLYNAMGFNADTPNVYPLPLVIAIGVMVFALRYWVFKLFERPTLSGCLVVLPIWYSPFFLQNLSYQYDGPAMVLGVVAVLYASVCQFNRAWQTLLVSSALLAASLMLYQLSINLFIVLCCIWLIRKIIEKTPPVEVVTLLASRVLALGMAVGLYVIGVSSLMNTERQGILAFSYEGVLKVVTRMVQVLGNIDSVFPVALKLIMAALACMAFFGYVQLYRRLVRPSIKLRWGVCLSVAYLFIIPVAIFCISGAALFFQEFNTGFRTFLGASGVLVMVFYLSHEVLVSFRWWGGLVLMVPLMYCLSVSYGYGRVLTFQEDVENSMLNRLAYDIGHSEVGRLNILYMIPALSVVSPPAAQGLYRAMPVLKEIGAFGYVVLPEMLPRVGVDNVYMNRDPAIKSVLGNGQYQPVVATADYEIYAVGETGYIVMKDVLAPVYDQADSCAQRAVYSC